jgi:hypothetical protein
MPDFNSPEEMIDAIGAKLAAATHELGPAYAEVAKLIADDARKRIGEYHSAVGPFPGWASLAESTMDERERLGYSRDEPLHRRGDLRDAIMELPSEESAIVAVPSKMVATENGRRQVDIAIIAEAQEHGTATIPPRPFLGPALWQNRREATAIVNEAIAKKLEE